MASRLQRAVVFTVIFAAALAASMTASYTTPSSAIVVGLIVLTGYVWILAAELLCLLFVEIPALRPSLCALVHAWWTEVLVAPRVFCWRQPFKPEEISDCLPKVPNGCRGILLVHGFLCNRGFWTPWMRQLRQLGHPFVAVDLEPVFGSIEAYARSIDRAVSLIEASTGRAPVIVAHSMGGLAVRHWLQTVGTATSVHRIITIGTPHRGTWLARFGTSESGRQMAIDSDWLNALAMSENPDIYRKFTCFYSNCDNVVFPSANAQLGGADNRRIEKAAHVSMAFRTEVFAEVLGWLGPGSRSCDQ